MRKGSMRAIGTFRTPAQHMHVCLSVNGPPPSSPSVVPSDALRRPVPEESMKYEYIVYAALGIYTECP